MSICIISLRLQTKPVIPNKADPIKSFDALGWHIFTSQSVHYFNMPPDPSKFLFRRIPKIIISLNTNKNSKCYFSAHATEFCTKITSSHSEHGITVYPCCPWPASLDYPLRRFWQSDFSFPPPFLGCVLRSTVTLIFLALAEAAFLINLLKVVLIHMQWIKEFNSVCALWIFNFRSRCDIYKSRLLKAMCYVFSLSFTAHTNSHTLELVHYVPKHSMLKYSQSSWMVYSFPVYILCTNAIL